MVTTYSTYDDIIQVVPEGDIKDITDDELTDAARTERVDRCRERAYNLINSYISGRYTVPFAATPDLVRDIEVDLAAYYLYQRTPDDDVAESIRNKYTDSIKLLERIASGVVRLDAVAAPVETSTAVVPRTNKKDRVFTSDLLGRMP